MLRSVKAVMTCGALVACGALTAGLGTSPPAAASTSLPTLVTTGYVCSGDVCQVGPGNVGVAFSAPLEGTGGTAGTQQCAYYLTVVSGSLPPGLVNGGPPCHGDLTGTPTRAGTYAFTVQITPGDNEFGQQAGPSGTQQLSITIGTGSSDRLVLYGAFETSARLNLECNVDEPILSFFASDANYGATYTVTETSTGERLDTFSDFLSELAAGGVGVNFLVPRSTAATFPSGTNEGSITVTDTLGGSAAIPVKKFSGC